MYIIDEKEHKRVQERRDNQRKQREQHEGAKSKELGYPVKECECEGEGPRVWSCCGDDITNNIGETDICPSCGEHCGDEPEECEVCDGVGFIKNEQ